MSVHQCPRCELRFRTASEYNYHLTSDHNVDPQAVNPVRYARAKQQQPLYPDLVEEERAGPRRILVVSNATLRAQRLQEALSGKAADGDVRFKLVVPAVRESAVSGEHSWFRTVGKVAHPREEDLSGRTLAQHRLNEATSRLRDAGIDIEGMVGDPDPMRAVADALKTFKADEIMLGTLPSSQSGWLNADLHTELQHRFRLPVTVVQAA
jgi:GABA permease